MAAVVAGGLAGAAVAVALGRRRGVGADEVQEPDEVEAVVDRPDRAAGA